MEPYEWRKRHPRCWFCKYYKLSTPAGIHGLAMPDIFKCLVKEKTINYPKMPRPWCKCFSLQREKEFEEALCSVSRN